MASDPPTSESSGIAHFRATVTNPIWSLFGSYVRPHLPYFGFTIGAALLSQVLWLYPPIVVGVAFDAVLMGDQSYQLPLLPGHWIPETRSGQFLFSFGVMAVCYVGASLVYLLGNWTRDIATYRLQHDLRADAYASMQELDAEFFETHQRGELMSVLNNDVNLLEGFFTGTLDQTTNATFITLTAGTYMLLLHWQLALVAFVPPLINGGFNYWYSRFVEPRHQDRRAQVGTINNLVENNISGMHVIKTYNRESYENERVADRSTAYKDVSWDIARTRTLINRITGWLPNAGYLLLFLLGGYWVLNGPPLFFSEPLAAGTLLAFLVYNNRLSWPLKQVTSIIDSYQEMKASAGRIVGLLEVEPTVVESEDAIDLDPMEGVVEYDDVSFAYHGGEETLSNVSFTAEPGEMVGLVGPTGAGKSTVVKLLLRFYDVDRGAIRVDDHDVRDLTLRSLRRGISYVGQEPYLFNGSVRENIAYSKPDATATEIREAARRAGADEFIAELSEGYDTQIGERGAKLSGGQRQRISIARAILNDPDVLVLDEATSHVDNETEALIQLNLEEIIENRTTFVIAHRLSTVRSADQILVLDDGEIVERGDHAELLERDGVYANLWRVQVGEIDSLPSEFVRRVEEVGD